jgi:hypothetical protein
VKDPVSFKTLFIIKIDKSNVTALYETEANLFVAMLTTELIKLDTKNNYSLIVSLHTSSIVTTIKEVNKGILLLG